MRRRSISWLIVLALAAGFVACPDRKPPGPAKKDLSEKVPVKTGAGPGVAWVEAERETRKGKPSGRGSLPGCTLTTHSVHLSLVVKTGETTRRIRFQTIHKGDTTRLPRYELAPGADGRCIALRAKDQNAGGTKDEGAGAADAKKGGTPKAATWTLVRAEADGSLVRVPGDTTSAEGAGTPCDRAGTLRQALLAGLAAPDRLRYLDKAALSGYVLAHPSDAELLGRFVTALLKHAQDLQATGLPPRDLPKLQARVCAEPKLVAALRTRLAEQRDLTSVTFRNAALFLERCRDAKALEILCAHLKERDTPRIYFASPALGRLAGDLGGLPPDCVPAVARHLKEVATGPEERAHLVWALGATGTEPARKALRHLADSGNLPPMSVTWPADFDALVRQLAALDSRARQSYARALTVARLGTNPGQGLAPRQSDPGPATSRPRPR